MAERKINSGVLFKNEKKTSDTQPDYTGMIETEKGTMRLAAWVRTGQNGKKYFSLLQSEQQPQQQPAPTQPQANNTQTQAPQPAGGMGGSDGDLPF